MTDSDNFYYEVMPFGLKNAGATYQRLMDHVFHGMIGRNVEVYVDEIVVKSDSCKQHIADLKEVFQALRQHRCDSILTSVRLASRGGSSYVLCLPIKA